MDNVSRADFFNCLYNIECKGKIELRAIEIGNNGRPARKFYTILDMPGINNFCQRYQNRELYFGIATKDGIAGGKDNIIHFPCLWCDIDFKNTPLEKANEFLKYFPIQPSIIVHSGGGFHAYWLLTEFLLKKDMFKVEDILKRLAQYFQGDMSSAEAAHVLRIPHTLNHKPDYSPDTPQVKIVKFEPNLAYELDDFDAHLPQLKATTTSGESASPSGWQDELLEGVGQGERNSTATKLAGRCLAKAFSKEETFTYLKGWNQRNKPPLSDAELKGTVESISKTDARNNPPQEDPLKFPDVISGVAGEFAKLYSGYLEVPESFFYMSYLACLGSILAKSLKLKTILDTQSRLYLLLLGESADDRKSTAIKQTIKFFKELLQQDFNVCWGANSAEGLQKVFNKDSKVFSGSTVLMAIDELKQLLSKCKIEGSTLLPMITTLFESNIYEAHTKNSDIYLKDAHLSLISASTLETYETVWDSSFTAIGFNNRLWIVPGATKKQFSFPGEIPEDKMDPIRQKTVNILRIVGEKLELNITPEGKEIFQSWYMDLESSIHTKRLDGYALRFMGLLAVNELRQEIGVDIVKKAISLCNWQLKVRQLYDPVDADTMIAKMEERIRRFLRDTPLPERELKRKLARIIKQTGIFCFTRAINNLKTAKDIYFKKDNKAVLIHLSE